LFDKAILAGSFFATVEFFSCPFSKAFSARHYSCC
jgi:hypothetical protein